MRAFCTKREDPQNEGLLHEKTFEEMQHMHPQGYQDAPQTDYSKDKILSQ